MGTEQDALRADHAPEEAPATRPRGRRAFIIVALLVGVVALNVLAFIFVPPFPKGGSPGDTCAFPVCFINGNLEFPPPHVVIDFAPDNPLPSGSVVIGFHPSITSTLLTMFVLTGLLLVAAFVFGRQRAMLPGTWQNIAEWVYESLAGFAGSLGGAAARPYVPIFAGFFLFIVVMNWSGLLPPIGKVEELRAPTSDINVTIGLALVAFLFFELQGFRKNGVRGYLGKFFPIYEFRQGLGAGLLAMYVGLVELLLEFVKPITLSMRLFGNIYGGEVALGVITALFVSLLPVGLLLLEGMLTFIQAIIFSVLTLMFTLIAIEHHGHEEGELAHEGVATFEEAIHEERLDQPLPAH
ncbi:MAG: F0F1 ATP synthase subunit A [Candidatus Limnocylindrales bacterium]